jgi:hypothetical protein
VAVVLERDLAGMARVGIARTERERIPPKGWGLVYETSFFLGREEMVVLPATKAEPVMATTWATWSVEVDIIIQDDMLSDEAGSDGIV